MRTWKMWFNKIMLLICGLLLFCYSQYGYAGNEIEEFLQAEDSDHTNLIIDKVGSAANRARTEQPIIINENMARDIAEVLREHPEIYELSLQNGWSFEPGVIQIILDGAMQVRKFSLIGSEIKDEAAKAIAHMIILNKNLVEINLRGSTFTTDGILEIARACMSNHMVRIEINFLNVDSKVLNALLSLNMRNGLITTLIRDMDAADEVRERLRGDIFMFFMGTAINFEAILNRVLTPNEIMMVDKIRRLHNEVIAELRLNMPPLNLLQLSETATSLSQTHVPLLSPPPIPRSALSRAAAFFASHSEKSPPRVPETPPSINSTPRDRRGDQAASASRSSTAHSPLTRPKVNGGVSLARPAPSDSVRQNTTRDEESIYLERIQRGIQERLEAMKLEEQPAVRMRALLRQTAPEPLQRAEGAAVTQPHRTTSAAALPLRAAAGSSPETPFTDSNPLATPVAEEHGSANDAAEVRELPPPLEVPQSVLSRIAKFWGGAGSGRPSSE